MNLLEINDLSKRYCADPKLARKYASIDILREGIGKEQRSILRPGEFWALKNVSLHVAPGEVVGIIGHNGAGKSTLINVASGILRPTTGEVFLNTPNVVVMDHRGGLSPVQTGWENVGNLLAIHGFNAHQIAEMIDSVVAFSNLEKFIHSPVGTYSLGMQLRLAFSIYSHMQPDLFIVDEALNGGDLKFNMKFKRFLTDYVAKGGAILLASHDLFTVQSLCHRCILMDYGKVRAVGPPEEIVSLYAEIAGEREAQDWQGKSALNASLTESFSREFDGSEGTKDEETVSGDDQLPKLPPVPMETVQFESVIISALDGGELTPGKPAEIQAVVNSLEPVSSITWSIELGTGGVFPLASLVGGYGGVRYSLKKGRNQFRCRIDCLPLLPGTHQMCSAISTVEGGIVLGLKGYQDAPVTFEVKGEPDRTMNISLIRRNLIYIPVNWNEMGS